ncbi:MAG: hypothetical protein CL582_15030, partial [Alteromonadaceae bacterium]|nr:hypothetical protein [Alteromonadaceae bacterium]
MANIKIDVVSLDGIANVVLPDGSVYPLDQVTEIDTNSVIQVADNGEVTLLLDGNLVTLTSGQSLAISNFLSSQSDEPAPFVESESSIAEDSIDDLLAEFGEADTPTSTDSFAEALAGDGDLLENLEATAAGISDGGGGAEGGNNFVRVARIAEETNPAAFEFSQTTQDNQSASFEPLDGVGENNALTEEPELTVSVAEISATTQPTVTGETNQPAGTPVTVTFSDESGNVSSLEVIVDDNGSFSATAPDELSEGGFTVEAELADGLGNPVTAEQSGNIDVTAPELAVTPADSGTGNTPVISGQTDQPPGSDVTVTITDANGDTQVVTGEVADDGSFTVTAPELPEGDYTVDVTVVDAAGNTTTSTQSGTVDTTAPTLNVTPVDSGTGNTPVISGQTDQPPGSDVTVTITDANGDTQVITGEVADDGTFTVTAPELPEGDYTVDVTVVDASGNTTTSTQSGTVDTTAPTLIVNDLGTGNDSTPTITGSGEVGAVVTVTVTDSLGNTQTIETVVDTDGNYSIDVPDALADGEYTV